MREIEVKARVLDVKALHQQLQAEGIMLGPELIQHDKVYGKADRTDNEAGSTWLRIRVEDKTKTYFTLKKPVRGHLDSIEHETLVEDAKELEEIIKLIGFEPYSDLTKSRRKAKVSGIEICVDTLERLGTYIEVEKLVEHDADYKEVEDELWDLLQKLGVYKADEELRGYDIIERAERGL